MSQKTLKYSQLLDYIIITLKRAKASNPNAYVSLTAILNLFEHSCTFSDVVEIGKYLETMGWVKASYLLGDVRVQIATGGLVYIEQKPEEFEVDFDMFINSMVKKYPEEKRPYIKLLTEDTTFDPKSTIYILIKKISEKIREVNGSDDFLKDLQVVEIEFSKVNPDLRMIETKLNRFDQISAVSDDLAQLKEYLSLG